MHPLALPLPPTPRGRAERPSAGPRRAGLLLLVPALLAAACTDPEPKAEGGGGDGGGEDTGDTGPDYEEGCHILDGGRGFAWVNDAIAVAEPGSTIELCPEGGVHEEAIVVDKAVTLQGPGADVLVLAGPVNEAPLTIVASGATVRGFGLEGTRSGLVVAPADAAGDAPTGVLIEDVQAVGLPNWGVQIIGATGVEVRASELVGNAYGGLVVEDGGEVLVSDSTVQANTSYGLRATGASTLRVRGSQILDTAVGNPEEPTDGYGAFADGLSTIVTEGDNTWAGHAYMGIVAQEADLDLTGDLVQGGTFGVDLEIGNGIITDVTIEGAYSIGLIALGATNTLVATGLHITADPEAGAAYTESDWNVIRTDSAGNITRWTLGAMGWLSQMASVSWEDGSVTGYNNAGALFLAADEAAVATVRRVDFVNNGRHGLFNGVVNSLGNATAMTAEDVRVIDTIGLDPWTDEEPACSLVTRTSAVTQMGGRLVWTGGEVSGADGYGIAILQGSGDVQGATIRANLCGGIINFLSAARIEGNTFSASGGDGDSLLMASVVDYQSSAAVVVNNTFIDNQTDWTYESAFTSGENSYRYVYNDKLGYDIFSTDSTALELRGNTFSAGTTSLYLSGGAAVIEDNAWSGYLKGVLTIVNAEAELLGNRFEGGGSEAIYCSDSVVSVEDTTAVGGSTYEYTYDFYFNDVLQSTNTSTYIGRFFYGNDCTATFEDVEIEDFQAAPFSSWTYDGSSYELIDVSIRDVNQDPSWSYDSAIYLSGYYGATSFYAENLEVSGTGSQGALEVFNISGATVDIEILGGQIDGTAGTSLYLSGPGVSTRLEDVQISGSGGAEGVFVSQGALELVNSTVEQGAGSGIELSNARLESSGSASINHAAYGLECSGASTTIDDCSALDLSGNTAGAWSGCDAACGVAP